MSRNDSNNNNNNIYTDFNSPNSNYLNTNSSSNTPFTSDSANTNINMNGSSHNNFLDSATIPYTNSATNFGFIDNYTNDIGYRGNSNISADDNNLDIEEFDKQFIDNLLNQRDSDINLQGLNQGNINNNISAASIGINLNGVPISHSNNFSMNTVNNSSTNTDTLSNSVYQSPQPVSLVRDASSLRTDTFSPQSLGFSTNFTSHKLGKSLSNSLAKSYGSQLGTSLNSLISPSSNYDEFLDSPYGSYNDDSLRSPINSPSLKSFVGSPSSMNTHLNPKSALSKETKLSRRRELHNAVERRRRDLIKEKIKELGSLIPPTMLYDSTRSKSVNKDAKANKNIILNKGVTYIMYLKEILAAQDRKLAELEAQVEQMNLNGGVQEEEQIDTTMQSPDVQPDLERFQKNLSAFTDDMDIRPSESKLNFMDFSNNHSEPLDFKKLSETYRRYPEANGHGHVSSVSNQNTPDDMDMLLNLEPVNSTEGTGNNDVDYDADGIKFNDNTANANNIASPLSNLQNTQSMDMPSPQDDFDHLMGEPGLQFKSDAEFLDQILSKKPVGGYDM